MFTWASNRKPMVLSVQLSPECWKPLPSGHSPTSALPSIQTPKQQFEGWAQTNLAPARDMPLRQGSTLRPSTGEGRE